MNRHLSATVLLVACGSPVGDGPPTARWVGEVFDGADDVPLGAILLPGTHDSASYGCSADLGISPHAGEPLLSLWDLPGADAGGAGRETVVGWAHTQDQTLAEQLEGGVRSVDVRVTTREGALVTWHSVYSVPLDEVLDDVVAFAAHHPTEPVVLGFGLDLADGDLPAFAAALAAPRDGGVSLCDLLFDGADSVADVPLGTLQRSGRNVVWGVDGPLRDRLGRLVDCPQSNLLLDGHWSRTTTPDGVAATLAATVADRPAGRMLANDFIFSLEGTSSVLEQAGFVTQYPTLRAAEVALGFADGFPGRLVATYDVDHRMNVLAGDFYEHTDLVAVARTANEARAKAP